MMQVFLLILTTAAVTVGITLLWLNLAGGGKNIRYTICSDYGVGDPQFERTIGQLLGPPLLGGNSVAVLRNGVEIFPAILVAIREAKKTICFETYIYWSGLIGNEISDALAERAERGVTVHVLLDW